MKRLPFLLLLLLTACLQVAAQSVNISGHITDTGTGGSLVNYPVEVVLYDSNTSNLILQSQLYTDTSGNYAFSFSTANGPAMGNGEVNVIDCNGSLQTVHFLWTNGSANLTNINFAICAASGGCNAGFVTGGSNGGLTVGFSSVSISTTGAIVSNTWHFGDSTVGAGTNPTHTYPATGTYYVCLTIVTSGGCTSMFCDSVVVGNFAPTCSATMTYGLLQTGAYGFQVTASGSGLPVRYDYDFGDGNFTTSFDDTVSYAYLVAGSYTACVTAVFSDSCLATGCVNVNTNTLNCQADFYSIPDTTGQYSLLLVNNSTGTGLGYLWDFGDGGTSTLAYPQHTYAGPGTYRICLTVWDTANTCTTTFCDSITVLNKLSAAFTIQVVQGALTGSPATATEALSVAVGPNPVQERLTATVGLQRQARLGWQVLDLNGRIALQGDAGIRGQGMHAITIPVETLAAGTYLLKLDAGTNGTHFLRIVVAD